jgi:S1-C subfamily serine protease
VSSRIASLEDICLQTHPARLGQQVSVLGYPLTGAMGTSVKITDGVVSSTAGYQDDVSTFQFSAAVQPGNSGSPVFSSSGALIGIVRAGLPAAQNVGYAVKAPYLELLIGQGQHASIPACSVETEHSAASLAARFSQHVVLLLTE